MEKLIKELEGLIQNLKTGELKDFRDPSKPTLRPKLKGIFLDMGYGVVGDTYDADPGEDA